MLDVHPNARRYSFTSLLRSVQYYLSSRNCYTQLRKLPSRPHPDTIKSRFGGLGFTGSDSDCQKTLEVFANSLPDNQKHISIIFDEIYLNPSLRFCGLHVVGRAEDDSKECARTMLCFMIRPVMGDPIMVRLVPVYSLKAEFLFR